MRIRSNNKKKRMKDEQLPLATMPNPYLYSVFLGFGFASQKGKVE